MTCRKLFIITGLLLMAFPGMSQANDLTQVWRDSEGVVIHNTWGMCVRSRWVIGTDACGQQPYVAQTTIAKEDRTVYFDFNKANLTEEAKKKLNSLATRLKSASDVQGAQIVGYADRIGTVSYNEKLSQKRAVAVQNYLVAKGIINTSVAQIRWFGKSEPSTTCSNKLSHQKLVECLQPDRRVQVELVYSSTP